MTKKLLKWTAAAAALVIVLAAGAIGFAYYQFTKPGPLAEGQNIIVPEGSSVGSISDLLDENDVIDDPFIFRLWVRIHGAQGDLKAGEFHFPAHVSQRGAMNVLVEGRAVLRQVLIPEGFTTYQIVQRLMATPGLDGPIRTMPREGELLPDTYTYVYGETRENLIERMRQAMRTTLAEAWESRQEGLPLESPREALILASIIEKETSVEAERRRIAAVFVNRLRRGMRLQTDPTVIYAITDGRGALGRRLLRRDLRRDHPYNTYVIEGLPPGPIANPGAASIRAAVNPAETRDLFFVATGEGGHAFAETYREHRRNVRRLRQVRSQRERAGEQADENN